MFVNIIIIVAYHFYYHKPIIHFCITVGKIIINFSPRCHCYISLIFFSQTAESVIAYILSAALLQILRFLGEVIKSHEVPLAHGY